jgi:hypothetical protein
MKQRIWLFLAILAFAIGFTETENVFSYLGKPLGAVFFGIYWISVFTRGAVAEYERDLDSRLAALHGTREERGKEAGKRAFNPHSFGNRPVPHSP